MKPHLANRVNFRRLEQFLTERRRIELLWYLCAQPVKYPARRRRGDREVPHKVPRAA